MLEGWGILYCYFILLKKIVVDAGNNNDIPQFLLLFPGEK